MTKEEARELLPIIQAYANGELIECTPQELECWEVANNPCWDIHNFKYRIKPKLKVPKTWEDYVEVIEGEHAYWAHSHIDHAYSKENIIKSTTFEGAYNEFKTKEEAEAFIALGKLIQLRDYCNEGWEPDWCDRTHKQCIWGGSKGSFMTNDRLKGFQIMRGETLIPCVLNFKNAEIRDEFYKNFKDLIEKVIVYITQSVH